jgi:glycosyltransferase involved in cell wall biosynthesis
MKYFTIQNHQFLRTVLNQCVENHAARHPKSDRLLDYKVKKMLDYADGFAKLAGVKSNSVVPLAMSDEPLVSIMIPTYRRPEFLKETIGSALSQEVPFPFAVIVVDNDPAATGADPIANTVKSFGATNLALYRNAENLGMVGNWNRCIELARSDWFVILHDDDLLEPSCIQKLFDNRSERAVIASSTKIFGEISDQTQFRRLTKKGISYLQQLMRYKFTKRRTILPVDVLLDCPITASGAMFNKTACIELGGYNLDSWPVFDYEFNAKYIANFGGVLLKDRLVRYRVLLNESNNPSTFLYIPNATYELRRLILHSMTSLGPTFNLLSLIIGAMHKYESQIARNKNLLLGNAKCKSASPGFNSRSAYKGSGLPPGLKLLMAKFFCWVVIYIRESIPGVQKFSIKIGARKS